MLLAIAVVGFLPCYRAVGGTTGPAGIGFIVVAGAIYVVGRSTAGGYVGGYVADDA